MPPFANVKQVLMRSFVYARSMISLLCLQMKTSMMQQNDVLEAWFSRSSAKRYLNIITASTQSKDTLIPYYNSWTCKQYQLSLRVLPITFKIANLQSSNKKISHRGFCRLKQLFNLWDRKFWEQFMKAKAIL